MYKPNDPLGLQSRSGGESAGGGGGPRGRLTPKDSFTFGGAKASRSYDRATGKSTTTIRGKEVETPTRPDRGGPSPKAAPKAAPKPNYSDSDDAQSRRTRPQLNPDGSRGKPKQPDTAERYYEDPKTGKRTPVGKGAVSPGASTKRPPSPPASKKSEGVMGWIKGKLKGK